VPPASDVRVSVICATYNRGPAIKETLQSVLHQHLTALELIVVSDGSTDDTDRHVATVADSDSRVRPLAVEHSGIPSRALNAGIELARGEYLAYIDHDDRWAPEHLTLLVHELEQGADLAAAGSVWVDEANEIVSVRPAAGLLWHPEIQVVRPIFENSQAAHRADWIDVVGPWREQSAGLEDWDMWLRFADAGARVATVRSETLRKTMGRYNRHRRIEQPHSFELVRCPDPRAARQAIRALMSPPVATQIDEAMTADTLAWYNALARTEQFVLPRGFASSRAEAIELIPQALREARAADRGLEDRSNIRIEPRGAQVAVVQDINCMTPEHAERFATITRRCHPRMMAQIEEATAAYSSEP